MYLTNDVITVLSEKLGFGNEDLLKIEADLELSAKCIGYLFLIRSRTVDKPQKLTALEKIQEIKDRLDCRSVKSHVDVDKARAMHYSFRSSGLDSRFRAV